MQRNATSWHLHDVPPDGGLGDWYSDATAEVSEHEDFERRVIHHVEEHLATDRHVALSHAHTRTPSFTSTATGAVEMAFKYLGLLGFFLQKTLKTKKSKFYVFKVFRNPFKIQILDSQSQQKIVAFQSNKLCFSYAI